MQRRDFIKYSALSGAGMIFPQFLNANKFTKAIEIAFWASKLNPVRLMAGLIFDEIAEVYVEPLARQAFNNFLSGKSISKSSLTFYDSTSVIEAKSIIHEPYKASIAVYGVVDYQLYRRQKIKLELKDKFDKERFSNIIQYLKDEKARIKLYDSVTSFDVGNSLESNDIFNIDYITFKDNKIKEVEHIKNLLEVTSNKAFSKAVV